MGIAGLNSNSSINVAPCFSLQPQDSQLKIFPASSSSSSSPSSSTIELSVPEKIESSFLTANAFNPPPHSSSSCVEMVSLSFSYTSLKDLMPPFPPAGISSSSQTWNEIHIKNRLVQKAASFYLQPMSSSRESNEHGFLEFLEVACSFHCRSNSECVHGCGCLDFVNQMIRETFQRFFGANRSSRRSVEFGSPLREGEGEGKVAGDS